MTGTKNATGTPPDRYQRSRPERGCEVVKRMQQRASVVASTKQEAIRRPGEIVQSLGGRESGPERRRQAVQLGQPAGSKQRDAAEG